MIRNSILDFLFPKRCLGCKTFGDYICTLCRETITHLDSQICPKCTRSAVDGVIHPGCRGRYTLNGLFVSLPYGGAIRLLIKRLKYNPWLTDLAGYAVSLSIAEISVNGPFQRFLSEKPLVVPVPLHWRRRLFRGYNQAELLGKEIAKKLDLPYGSLLCRHRKTQVQYGLTERQRKKNVSQSISILPSACSYQYRSVLIVDDIWTTGATIRACANILKRAGMKTVWGLAIAR